MDAVSYAEHLSHLPETGRHIVGQYSPTTVTVYQEFNKQIAQPALRQQRFVPPFSLTRLSWIKTNFMWMMFRSEWGQISDYVLAIHVKREAFEEILAQAEHAQFAPHWYSDTKTWRNALRRSDIRIQWDPEHDPAGGRMPRKALQIGLSGEALAKYASQWVEGIEDISDFVRRQRPHALSGRYNKLQVPLERLYQPSSNDICQKLQLDEAALPTPQKSPKKTNKQRRKKHKR